MINKNILDELYDGKLFILGHNLKFINKDYEFEYVTNSDDESFKYRAGQKTDDGCFLYKELFTNKYIKIKGDIKDFSCLYQIEYNNQIILYSIYKAYNIEYIYIDDLMTYGDTIDIPDVILGRPVFGVNLNNEIDYQQIKRLVVGNNLLLLQHYKKKINNLTDVVIKKDFAMPLNVLLPFLMDFVHYSLKDINIIADDNDYFKIRNNCVISGDGKELFLITQQKNIVIPDNVEYIHYYAFQKKYNKIDDVTYPDSIQIIEDEPANYNRNIQTMLTEISNFDKKISNVPHYLNYIDFKFKLHFADKLKELNIPFQALYISETLLKKIIGDDAENFCFYNYFVKENNFIMTKDRKSLVIIDKNFNNKTIVLPSTIEHVDQYAFSIIGKNNTLILNKRNEQIIEIAKMAGVNIKVAQSEASDSNIGYSEKPVYSLVRSKCQITNDIKVDKLTIDISLYPDTYKKTFIINKHCANIKELVIPEGITNIEFDDSCFLVDFNMEILDLPSTCKFSSILKPLNNLNKFMMLIINPNYKPKWVIHKLSFIVACRGKYSMPSESNYEFYSSYYEFSNYGDYYVNEITYVRSFEPEKLIVTDKAYYYIKNKSKKEVKLLKVRPGVNFVPHKTVGQYKLAAIDSYCYSKIETEENKDLLIYDVKNIENDISDEVPVQIEGKVETVEEKSVKKNSKEKAKNAVAPSQFIVDKIYGNDNQNLEIVDKSNEAEDLKNSSVINNENLETEYEVGTLQSIEKNDREIIDDKLNTSKAIEQNNNDISDEVPVQVEEKLKADNKKAVRKNSNIKTKKTVGESQKKQNDSEKSVIDYADGYEVDTPLIGYGNIRLALSYATKYYFQSAEKAEKIAKEKLFVSSEDEYSIKAFCYDDNMHKIYMSAKLNHLNGHATLKCNCKEMKSWGNPCMHLKALSEYLDNKYDEKMALDSETITESSTLKNDNNLTITTEEEKSTSSQTRLTFDEKVAVVDIFLMIIAVIISYCTYAHVESSCAYSNVIIKDINIGERCGFIYGLFYFISFLSLISFFFNPTKKKGLMIVSSICSFVLGVIFIIGMALNTFEVEPYNPSKPYEFVVTSFSMDSYGYLVPFIFFLICIGTAFSAYKLNKESKLK